MTPITYKETAEYLDKRSLGAIHQAVAAKVLTKYPMPGQVQHLIQEQVELFKGKRLSKRSLSPNELLVWQKYHDAATHPIMEKIPEQSNQDIQAWNGFMSPSSDMSYSEAVESGAIIPNPLDEARKYLAKITCPVASKILKDGITTIEQSSKNIEKVLDDMLREFSRINNYSNEHFACEMNARTILARTVIKIQSILITKETYNPDVDIQEIGARYAEMQDRLYFMHRILEDKQKAQLSSSCVH